MSKPERTFTSAAMDALDNFRRGYMDSLEEAAFAVAEKDGRYSMTADDVRIAADSDAFKAKYPLPNVQEYLAWLEHRYAMSERQAIQSCDTYDAVRCTTFLVCLDELRRNQERP